jgi:murein DD-endopeptidase
MKLDGAAFFARALRLEGLPYIWAAKGPLCFDCSGLVTYLVREMGGPDWRALGNCAFLWEKLAPFTPEAAPFEGVPPHMPVGTLAFYGPPGRADHVMVVSPEGRAFGACGGGSACVTPKRGACVQFRPSIRYRPDFLGFRALEWP